MRTWRSSGRSAAEEKNRTVEIADYRAYIETKSYIEEIAREVLGLVYKDEIIFKPVTNVAPRGDELSSQGTKDGR